MAVHAIARLAPGIEKLTFMTGGFVRRRRRRPATSRARATPARTASRSRWPPPTPTSSRARCSAQPEVKPVGLGARDSLRLEAGLCLYGHDIDTTTTPVEAALTWAIQKVRRPGGAREGGYPGADVDRHAARRRRAAASASAWSASSARRCAKAPSIVDAHGHKLGVVTSGTLAPTVNQPVAMAYLPVDHAIVAHEVYAEVRGKRLPMRVATMPFTPNRYFRG